MSIQAEKLILLTNTPGILNTSKETISRLTMSEIHQLVDEGTITEGMLPKAQCAIEAIEGDVQSVHIIDGRVPHALLLEVLTDGGIGTLLT